MKKFYLVFRLFRSSLWVVGILYFLSVFVFLMVVILKDSYKKTLQDEFATKQPHIKITYINNTILDEKGINKEIKFIKSYSNLIGSISPFVEKNRFFTAEGYSKSSTANSQYNGDVKIIGLSTKEFVYNFFDAQFINKFPFDTKLTSAEFLYYFRNQKNSVIFNKTLYLSFFPIPEGVERFSFVHKPDNYNIQLLGVFTDYDKKSILYTNIHFANKLLNQNPNKIDGFFVNAKKLEDIDTLTKELKSLPKDKYIVSSWLELRKKQYTMFSFFEGLSFVIANTILLLTILLILLILYYMIIKKSYQLSVFYSIGYMTF
jgi:ABC-type lipoprotein release transport system permease subunit